MRRSQAQQPQQPQQPPPPRAERGGSSPPLAADPSRARVRRSSTQNPAVGVARLVPHALRHLAGDGARPRDPPVGFPHYGVFDHQPHNAERLRAAGGG